MNSALRFKAPAIWSLGMSSIIWYEFNSPEGGRITYTAWMTSLSSGNSTLGGKVPVNTSGGLMRKGHPVGATGASQIFELVCQLRGEAGDRQVDHAKLALAENGGAFIGSDVAALALTVLKK